MFPVEIRMTPALRLAGLLHTGPYDQIGPTFQALGARLDAAGLMDKASLWAGVYHDDPAAQMPEALRSHACAALPPDLSLPDGFERIDIAAARSAVMTVTGSYEQLGEAWNWLYRTWLPHAGETPTTPACEVYVSMAPMVDEAAQITEIRVPLR